MTAAKDNPMPFDFAAYFADTTHLVTLEHGSYFLILGAMWRSPDGHIESDDKYLARVAKLPLDKWKRIAPTIRALLSIRSEDGRVSQKRLLRVRAEVQNALELGGNSAPSQRAGNGAKSLKTKKAVSDGAESLSLLPLETDSDSENKSKKVSGKPAPLPEDWVPADAERLYGKSACGLTDEEIDQQAERLRRWALNNAHTAKGKKPRWDLCFRNFLDSAGEQKRAKIAAKNLLPQRTQGSASRGRKSFGDLALEAVEEAQGMAAQGPVEVNDVKH